MSEHVVLSQQAFVVGVLSQNKAEEAFRASFIFGMHANLSSELVYNVFRYHKAQSDSLCVHLLCVL